MRKSGKFKALEVIDTPIELTKAGVENGQVEGHPALIVLPVDEGGGGGHLLHQQAHQLQALCPQPVAHGMHQDSTVENPRILSVYCTLGESANYPRIFSVYSL